MLIKLKDVTSDALLETTNIIPVDFYKFSELVKSDIDLLTAKAESGFRTRLGASQIAAECIRQSWYTFRWVGAKVFVDTSQEAAMRRLWARGHRDESVFISYLKNTGWSVFEFDTSKTNKDGTHPQFTIGGYKGHYGGSADGVGIAPKHYNFNEPILLEFKTASNSRFNTLKKNGVRKAESRHVGQMQAYGGGLGLKYALYIAVNKNNDELYVEMLELCLNTARAIEAVASSIIDSKSPPDRISNKRTFWLCKMCDFAHVCHSSKKSNVNCRSCKHATAVENGEWQCDLANATIPKNFIPSGCANWADINNV